MDRIVPIAVGLALGFCIALMTRGAAPAAPTVPSTTTADPQLLDLLDRIAVALEASAITTPTAAGFVASAGPEVESNSAGSIPASLAAEFRGLRRDVLAAAQHGGGAAPTVGTFELPKQRPSTTLVRQVRVFTEHAKTLENSTERAKYCAATLSLSSPSEILTRFGRPTRTSIDQLSRMVWRYDDDAGGYVTLTFFDGIVGEAYVRPPKQ